MFVTEENNYQYALNLWQGKPSGHLLWSLDANNKHQELAATQCGRVDSLALKRDELGCLLWASMTTPYETKNQFVEVIRRIENEITHIEYRSVAGTLTETIQDGQIIKHKVDSPETLKILLENWRHSVVSPVNINNVEYYALCAGKYPVIACTDTASSIQHMLQHETGVANLWYLLIDEPELVEEAMEIWQELLRQKYLITQKVAAIGWYQAENTSTSMISPDYYQQYSMNHIKMFANMASAAGCRTLVHMCGRLYDIMPFIRDTGINGIHSLTPPTTGNVSFEYAYKIMPDDSLIMGRFGSTDWIGKSKADIMRRLAEILPHYIYQEHPFMLLATSDNVPFTADNVKLLRDCINEYEKA
jgi:Uroporphyrinogen decarboxylase (URO-D)